MALVPRSARRNVPVADVKFWWKAGALVLPVLLLAACGGGGSDAGGAALALTSGAISVQGTTAANVQPTATVTLTLSPAVATQPYYTYTFAGTAIAQVSFNSASSSGVSLNVVMWAPGQLGAGTYNDTLKVIACTDPSCSHPYGNSPVSVPVTYVVTGSAQQDTTFQISGGSQHISFTGTTTATAGPTANVLFYLNDDPPNGIYIKPILPAGGLVSAATLAQPKCSAGCTPNGSGTMTVTGVPPSQLGSGIYTGSFQIELCFDAACTQQLAGSPVTFSVSYTVTLTQGSEFTTSQVTLPAANDSVLDLAWNATDQYLYVLEQTGTGPTPSSLAQLDPSTGVFAASIGMNDSVGQLALSDDGQYAYVNSTAQALIYRSVLANLSADIQIPLGTSSIGDPIIATQIAVAPGTPHTIAVAETTNTVSYGYAVQVFDDATARAQALNTYNANSGSNDLAWGASNAVLYDYNYVFQPFSETLDTLAVSSSGVAVTNAAPINNDPIAGLTYANGNLYTLSGEVHDAASFALTGNFAIPSGYDPIALAIDVPNNQAFILADQGEATYDVLLTFDLTTLQLESLASLPQSGSAGARLVRWGSDGLAFGNAQTVYLISGTVVAPGAGAAKPRSAPMHALPSRIAGSSLKRTISTSLSPRQAVGIN